ncbi:MAG: putative hydro-lyase [Clostridiaceae bacterium]|jgi:uncharacterized protein YcsI (UPF0317 family)|nr:putative hydro-lyase [Clostridiaceae bacterium]
MEDWSQYGPAQMRRAIRQGKYQGPTAGLCMGFAQCNLIALPKSLAYDFLLFAQRNSRACPVLEVSDAGSRRLEWLAQDLDLARDFPRYRLYENGELTGEYTDAEALWRPDLVSFLIGCSFSFEGALLEAGLPVRHIEQGRNVPMYRTNLPCRPAGVFHGNMVVSMRPMTPAQAIRAANVTAAMPRVHGAPIHWGDPATIGIQEIDRPDYGDAVDQKPGEIPVFWPCGVTPQNVVTQAKPPFAITHSPGHMLITDIPNSELKD